MYIRKVYIWLDRKLCEAANLICRCRYPGGRAGVRPGCRPRYIAGKQSSEFTLTLPRHESNAAAIAGD